MEIDLQPMSALSVISQDLTPTFDKSRLTFGEEPAAENGVDIGTQTVNTQSVNRRRVFLEDLLFSVLSVIFGCTVVGCVAVYYTVLANFLWNKNRKKSKKLSEKSHIIATSALIAGLMELVLALLIYLVMKSNQECRYEVGGGCYMTYIETNSANCTSTGFYDVDKVYKDGYCYYRHSTTTTTTTTTTNTFTNTFTTNNNNTTDGSQQ